MMSDIKMSDDNKLIEMHKKYAESLTKDTISVKTEQYGMCDAIFVGRATIAAEPLISELYRQRDANQERIADLDELRKGCNRCIKSQRERITELEKESVHWKANHDNVVEKLRCFTRRPDLTINKQQEEIKALNAGVIELVRTAAVMNLESQNNIDEQQQEIAELKRLVDFDTKAILEDCETIDSQKSEIAELKAQIELLRDSLSFINNFCLEFSDLEQFNKIYEWGSKACDLLDKTPQQCIADIRAEAVDDAIKYAEQFVDNDSFIEVKAYAQQLRKRGEKCL